MIGIVGVNHGTASLEVREKLAFSREDSLALLGRLKNDTPFTEAVLLSTCNRTELCFSLEKPYGARVKWDIVSLFADCKKLGPDIESGFYGYSDYEAVLHLFRVVAGLDSMVIGENQILGQLKRAYQMSYEIGMTGTVLNRLFHKAFEAGKRVRAETDINKGASSIGYAAVELAQKVFGDLENCTVLLIGAGEAGEMVLRCLKKRGSGSVIVINRTMSRAGNLAERYGAEARDYCFLEKSLKESDIVITSTAAGKKILSRQLITGIARKRKGKLFLLIDLSVPRNIDESVRDNNGVFLFNIDELHRRVAFNCSKRYEAVTKSELIVEEMAKNFMVWKNEQKLSPTIESLKKKLNSYTKNELLNIKKRVSEDEYVCVRHYSDFITKKYLGLVIKNLRRLTKNGNNLEYIDLVNNLFDLEQDPGARDARATKSGENSGT